MVIGHWAGQDLICQVCSEYECVLVTVAGILPLFKTVDRPIGMMDDYKLKGLKPTLGVPPVKLHVGNTCR